jgi:hypothetical protein
MPLEPVYEDEDSTTKLQLQAGAVCISPEKRQIVGFGVETVETSSRLI